MAEQRKRLEETARVLRVRLNELEQRGRQLEEVDRPIYEVALQAVRRSLTDVGRQLVRIAA